jgi:Domain of unknown function (DUF4301)
MTDALRGQDVEQLRGLGISPEEVARQLRLFAQPPPGTRLDRACTAGDGIRILSDPELDAAEAAHAGAAHDGRFGKLVPASGAASRMFKGLLAMARSGAHLDRRAIEESARSGNADARELLAFIDGIERFAFFDDLEAARLRAGLGGARDPIEDGHIRALLEILLTPQGLDYAALPKGLIKFHRYPGECRTPFAEHLVEAALYARDVAGVCRLHFTVSSEHRERFQAHLAQVAPQLAERYAARFEVGFSEQKRSTDTIAVDLENRPLRTGDGRLLFRPGGHGALIENLGALGGDIVYVKNIDNVVPDDRKPLTVRWKKVLGGLLAQLQAEVFRHLSRLAPVSAARHETAQRAEIDAALGFVRDVLQLPLPTGILAASPGMQHAFLTRLLDRPIRVCGMVRSTGDPGGGPFWVVGPDGGQSPQIVEHAQVDGSPEQEAIYSSSTHFNPVDLVCGLRDSRGRPFDLRRYVDPSTVFISRKSSEGRELKALEHPGLWNGAMADWITVFVEVPAGTFTPVKTVNDLLRPEHQPSRSPSG